MSMDPELLLQQCRIYQNKHKEEINLTYADEDGFYKILDRYVYEGYKVRLNFLNDKLAQGSALIERIISCLNGQILIDDYINIYAELHDILAFTSQDAFIEAIIKCLETNIKIYNNYFFEYIHTDNQGEGSIIRLAPASEGLPSQSFTVDI